METNRQISEAFLRHQYLFEYLLWQEHEREVRASGCKHSCSYKGMGCRHNIVRFNPTMAAAAEFLEYGYLLLHLVELRNWYQSRGEQGAVDAETLGIFLTKFFKRRQR